MDLPENIMPTKTAQSLDLALVSGSNLIVSTSVESQFNCISARSKTVRFRFLTNVHNENTYLAENSGRLLSVLFVYSFAYFLRIEMFEMRTLRLTVAYRLNNKQTYFPLFLTIFFFQTLQN